MEFILQFRDLNLQLLLLFQLPLINVEDIDIVGDTVIDYLQDLLTLFEFEHHPPHLNVELGVELLLQAPVHTLHELLDDVFDVLNIGGVSQLLLETLLEGVHDFRGVESASLSYSSAALLLFQLFEYF